MSLSDKITTFGSRGHSGVKFDYLLPEDVKEFIKLLKDHELTCAVCRTPHRLNKIVDKLAGDKFR